MELNKIYNEDCLIGMQDIPDKSIDLIITDPPYGKKADKGTNGFGSSKNRKYTSEWDKARPSKEYFDEMFRISKNVIIFGGNYFSDMLPPSNCWIVWDKKGDVAFQNPFADCELIYTSFRKPIKKIVFKQQGFITDSKDKRFHPTQKPSELIAQLVEMFSEQNQKILDPFIGSGTTAIACINTNRNYIGFEKDKTYFDIANERIARCIDAI